MKTPIKSLNIVLGTTLSFLAGTQSASATFLNWSYTTLGDDVYTGRMEGEIQSDKNTVNVTSVFMSQLNGTFLVPTPIVLDISAVTGTTGVVSFNGSIMSLAACRNLSCFNGDKGGIFIGDFGNSVISFTTINDFNVLIDDETFAPQRWELATVPEPSSTLALVGLGLSSLAISVFSRRKKTISNYQNLLMDNG